MPKYDLPIIYLLNLGTDIIKAQENARKSDSETAGCVLNVPVIISPAVSMDGIVRSPKVLTQETVSGANSLSTLGIAVKPIFKSQAVCDSITI